MKGYSFRSLTDLVLKIFKTKVNAGTGLSGGGSLEADRTLTVNYGTTAGTATQGNDSRVVNAASNATVNAKEAALEAKKADKSITIIAGTGLTGGGTLAANRTLNVSYGTVAGTAAQGNDGRLSNSREWTGETISQAEAEVGTATTRRAFTAQRVRQAIVAWFNGISGALGRTILTRTTAEQVQSDIGLGTAAIRDVGTSSGQVMEVGAFGLGTSGTPLSAGYDLNNLVRVGFYAVESDLKATTILNSPTTSAFGISVLPIGAHSDTSSFQILKVFTSHKTWTRYAMKGTWSSWEELLHTGNLLQSTGSSTSFPMSQKAVTDRLDALGTAATANLTTSHTDSTYGRVLRVGDFGLGVGAQSISNISDLNDLRISGWHNIDAGTPNWAFGGSGGIVQQVMHQGVAYITQIAYSSIDNRILTRTKNSSTNWTPWEELLRTGNTQQSTGTSTNFPMSQKAVTDQLATKANTSTQVIAGTGLTGGGSLAANRTLTIASSHIPVGVGQTWQVVTGSRTIGTTYTNTTGRPIMVTVMASSTSYSASFTLNGDTTQYGHADSRTGQTGTYTTIIPSGSTYSCSNFSKWLELR